MPGVSLGIHVFAVVAFCISPKESTPGAHQRRLKAALRVKSVCAFRPVARIPPAPHLASLCITSRIWWETHSRNCRRLRVDSVLAPASIKKPIGARPGGSALQTAAGDPPSAVSGRSSVIVFS